MSGMRMQAKSKAIPFLEAPPALDEGMVGYAGFDPLWVSSMLPDKGYVKFLQEAEIKHGRVAMLAAAGAIVQDIFTFPGVTSVIGNGDHPYHSSRTNLTQFFHRCAKDTMLASVDFVYFDQQLSPPHIQLSGI